ncbi:hypothetical protein TNCV_4210061 [Trichonephila clavipes]|nr:hypothetical protein TNCV_4210061 [Trichonephila clavipes]
MRVILTSPYNATRELLATDHAILNHGQVIRTTLELAAPSPNFSKTATEGSLRLGRFNVHRTHLQSASSVARHKFMAMTIGLPRPQYYT